MNLRISSVIGVMVLSLTGCAMSPHQIDYRLSAPQTANSISLNEVDLSVIDRRNNKQLGSLGGIYAKTATLSDGKPLDQQVKAALVQYFIAQKTNMVSSNDAKDFNVYIEQLNYRLISNEWNKKNTQVDIKMSFDVKTYDDSFNKVIDASANIESTLYLKSEQIDELVSGLIDSVIEEALNDASLLQALSD